MQSKITWIPLDGSVQPGNGENVLVLDEFGRPHTAKHQQWGRLHVWECHDGTPRRDLMYWGRLNRVDG